MEISISNVHTAKEQIMLSRLLDAAKKFYEKPKNCQAFDAWRKNKEVNPNATNYVNA